MPRFGHYKYRLTELGLKSLLFSRSLQIFLSLTYNESLERGRENDFLILVYRERERERFLDSFTEREREDDSVVQAYGTSWWMPNLPESLFVEPTVAGPGPSASSMPIGLNSASVDQLILLLHEPQHREDALYFLNKVCVHSYTNSCA